MTDEEETADAPRNSRIDRFKSALSRTKTKLRRKDTDQNADDEMEDFLAAGRNSTSTGRPSISDSLTFADSVATQPSERPSTSGSSTNVRNTQVPYPDAFVPLPQQSPRRIVVPRIDVSNSQRYPTAQPVGQIQQQRNEFLRPQYQGRSQSVSSFSKGRGRARGLSVQFTETPPIVIGEGGDEAQAPTIEVSKAKRRARSVSPTRTPRTTGPIGKIWSKSPSSRKPVPEKVVSPVKEEDDFFASGLKRVPTGMTPLATENKHAFEMEFEMSLGLNSASTNSPESARSPGPPTLHAPTPVRPPVTPPQVHEPPMLKSAHGTKNLRKHYEKDQSASQMPEQPDPEPNQRFYAQQQELVTNQVPDQRGRGGHPAHQRTENQQPRKDDQKSWL